MARTSSIRSIPLAFILDRVRLCRILNSSSCDECPQVIAYNLLNIRGYRPTEEEWTTLMSAAAGLPPRLAGG